MLNHVGTITINAKRLTLKKFGNTDVKSTYKNWSGDKETIKNINFTLHKSLNDTEDFIMESILNYTRYNYNYAVELKSIKEIIGAVQLTNIDDYLKKCDIGFVMGSKFWNKGYATEALNAILGFCFDIVGFVKVIGLCKLDNPASEKVMQKCNMQFEGIARKEIRIENSFYDAKVYSILDDDFKTINLSD